MKRLSPLVLDFLDNHPADCARVLEQFSTDTACSLIRSIKPARAAPVIACMVTSYGSECIDTLDIQSAVSILTEMKTPQAARLLRAMDRVKSRKILDILPSHVRNNINAALRYPDQTVGRIMDSNPFSLPESITISDALKRVKNLRERTLNELFVVDDDHQLTGVIYVADLLSAAGPSSLQTITKRDVPCLSTRMSLHAAAVHLGWQTFSALPVVGKDHVLSGILKSSALMQVLAENHNKRESAHALNELFSLTEMYWIVMSELINSVAGDRTQERGVRD
jgi:magnesium transporter